MKQELKKWTLVIAVFLLIVLSGCGDATRNFPATRIME